MATYLDRILAAHRAAAGADRRDLAALLEEAVEMPAARPFGAALRSAGQMTVIAEIKRRSPSRGDLAPDADPERTARQYERGGAACLSVLTDADFFAGSAADLRRARAATSLPVLRKDFTVGPADVIDARLMGADAVLLIVAALEKDELAALLDLARRVGLDALVEVHDEAEATVAIDLGAELIGVNQRDLFTFEVDTDRARRVGEALPASVTRVAESGIRGRADAERLADAGFHALLVGESLITSADPAAAVTALRVDRPAD